MNYRFEYTPNPEYGLVHVGMRLTERYVSKITLSSPNRPEETNLLDILSGAKGAREISLRPYEITVQISAAFTKDEVLQNVVNMLKMWAITTGECDEGETWTQLPTLRSDIKAVQCPMCQEEQRREIARTMRDFDTLDW
jgi:hypothetical protein